MDELIIRTTLPEDREAVFQFCARTWGDDGDYIPHVWEKWLNDKTGRMITAVIDGKPVGMSKLTMYTEKDAWLEGLRVDPACRGRGLANALSEFMRNEIAKRQPETEGYLTEKKNSTSVHLGRKIFGYDVLCELAAFDANNIERIPTVDAEIISPNYDETVAFLLEFLREKKAPAAMMLYWSAIPARPELLREFIAQDRFIAVRRPSGALDALAYLQVHPEHKEYWIHLMGNPFYWTTIAAHAARKFRSMNFHPSFGMFNGPELELFLSQMPGVVRTHLDYIVFLGNEKYMDIEGILGV